MNYRRGEGCHADESLAQLACLKVARVVEQTKACLEAQWSAKMVGDDFKHAGGTRGGRSTAPREWQIPTMNMYQFHGEVQLPLGSV